VLNTTSLTFSDIEATSVRNIAPISPTITRALELGYKGILGGTARVAIDLWYENKSNFVGPLIVESPNVFLNTSETIAYLTPLVGPATAAQLGTAMGGLSGATSASRAQGIPLATVVPHNAVATQRPDIFLTYRNFGEVDLFGTDVAVDYVVSQHFTLAGTFSLANKDYYTREDVRREGEVTGFADVTLNAPTAKGSVAVRYRNERAGLSGETRFRAVKGFPINSGVFNSGFLQDGETPAAIASYSVMDAQLAYRLPVGPRSATISLIATNLLNTPYATFVGVPSLGRTVISKVSYTF
jgi:iron complex outermembrane receptor protein